MYQLFETIRIENGVVQHLDYHQQRVNQLASHSMTDYIVRLELPHVGTYRLRIDYTPMHSYSTPLHLIFQSVSLHYV